MIEKLLIRKILEQADKYEWFVLGLGFYKLHLSDSVRLHVWDSAARVKGASVIHTHPWGFTSKIISGVIRDTIYIEQYTPEVCNFTGTTIVCGQKGENLGITEDVCLIDLEPVEYHSGEEYVMSATDIHSPNPEDGTVTIITKNNIDSEDQAKVYYPIDEEWGSAEPRRAEQKEVVQMAAKALELILGGS